MSNNCTFIYSGVEQAMENWEGNNFLQLPPLF